MTIKKASQREANEFGARGSITRTTCPVFPRHAVFYCRIPGNESTVKLDLHLIDLFDLVLIPELDCSSNGVIGVFTDASLIRKASVVVHQADCLIESKDRVSFDWVLVAKTAGDDSCSGDCGFEEVHWLVSSMVAMLVACGAQRFNRPPKGIILVVIFLRRARAVSTSKN